MEVVCLNRPMMVEEPFHLRQNLRSKSTKRRRLLNDHVTTGRTGFIISNSWASTSQFQDFRTFAQPLRLLPATEVNIHPFSEELLSRFGHDKCSSLYSIQLCTSSDQNSGLNVSTSAVLICLIGENGDCILQRIPSMSSINPNHSEEVSGVDYVCFQRGSVDHFTFQGPKLSKIEALWIGVESGRWRLEAASLAVISPEQSKLSSENEKTCPYSGVHYKFWNVDIPIGDGADISMAELRPCDMIELSTVDLFNLSNIHPQSTPLQKSGVLLEDGMRDYGDLKFSMLLYDLVLILGGTYAVATLTSDGSSDVLPIFDRTASIFLIGGICGFLYLFNLQRTVDRLSSPSSTETNSPAFGFERLWQRAREPIPAASLTLVIVVLASKYFLANMGMAFTSQELFAFVSGFFTCKLAVVVAAFRPVSSLRKIK